MQSIKFGGAAFALMISTLVPAAAQDVNARTVIATVGGEEITVGHLLIARSTLPDQYKQLPNEVLLPGLIDQLIQQTALAQAVGDTLTLREQIGLQNQTAGFRAGVALNRAADSAVTDDALKAAYDTQFSNAAPDREYNAAHILVETEEEANEIKKMLDDGGDFAELAKEKSTGPSGPNGGSLGWFAKGMMVPEFEEAVIALDPGQVSAPVKTQFGWHVVKLNETRSKETPTFEQVRDSLIDVLRSEAVTNIITTTVEAAEVIRPEGLELEASILDRDDLLDQ